MRTSSPDTPGLPSFNAIGAVIFDMDGTLIDSESFCDRAILDVLAEEGIDARSLDPVQFHGIAWQRIALRLRTLYPPLPADGLQERIASAFNQLLAIEKPPFLPGARAAFQNAAASFPVAVATGSDRAAVEATLERGGLHPFCYGFIACEDYHRSKPYPEPYIRTAAHLGIAPDRCLVFEDSLPGLEAAKNAGMRTIGVTSTTGQRLPTDLADGQIADYRDLPADFFAELTRS